MTVYIGKSTWNLGTWITDSKATESSETQI